MDLISDCLAVSLFNLAVCLSYGGLLPASVPTDETFPAAVNSAIACTALRGAASVRCASHSRGRDLNDGRRDWPSVSPFAGPGGGLGAGLLIK